MVRHSELERVKMDVMLLRGEVARLTQHVADGYVNNMDSYDARGKVDSVRYDIGILMDYLGLEIQDLPAARKVVKKEK